MDELSVILFLEPEFLPLIFTRPSAAYQVGLSFLTNHMRRAVAACTSPEVFFGPGASGASGESALMAGTSNAPSDPLELAMESLDLNV